MEAPLSTWPWDNLGSFKYLLYGPLLAKWLYARYQEDNIKETWCLHILIICCLRCSMHHTWNAFSSMLFLTRNRRINKDGVGFKQIDNEWDWDNFILLHGIMGSIVFYMLKDLINLPLWDFKGLMAVAILHIAISEPLYYYLHKRFHGSYLFNHYHSLHHSSPVLQPFTAGHATILEHIILAAVMGIPILGTCFIGYGSITMIYGYILIFDCLRCLGHSNFEIIPHQLFKACPLLKYLLYTPTYHSLHHTEMGTNYCLFMPLFDALGNTLNPKSWDMHTKFSVESGKNGRVPDFVFLAHVVDLTSAMHVPFLFRSFGSKPFSTRLFLLPLLPIAFVVMLVMWAYSKVFLNSFYNLRGRLHQTWVVPRFGFQDKTEYNRSLWFGPSSDPAQSWSLVKRMDLGLTQPQKLAYEYFLPFAAEGINNQVEQAILRADRLGVKVISLAALNKNEALNGGGTLFVNKHPNLKVRVVHGNTLTAALILKEIPENVTEAFLSGATSKLGRVIALYLCKRQVRVLMLTSSTERFQKIQKEAPAEYQKYLVQVTKYEAARNCKTWIVGKWITPRQQSYAPKGTHFHQFVVPPILSFRRDCTYGDLAAMRLPEDVQGLGSCEYTMERGVVHACHAGGVVHSLEGWTHHEVGAIDVDRIDLVWEAAVKHGLKPVSSLKKTD